MSKIVNLPIKSIQYNKTTDRYVIVTEVSKQNPFTNGVCQLSAKQLDNMASKTPAGDIESLIGLVAFGDASLSVEITGAHKAGDVVLDNDGKTIEVPVNERADRSCNDKGELTYAKDGATINQLGYAVELGDAALLNNLVANKMAKLSSRSTRKVTATETAEVEVAETTEQIGA